MELEGKWVCGDVETSGECLHTPTHASLRPHTHAYIHIHAHTDAPSLHSRVVTSKRGARVVLTPSATLTHTIGAADEHQTTVHVSTPTINDTLTHTHTHTPVKSVSAPVSAVGGGSEQVSV